MNQHQELIDALLEIEMHCPCGARPESIDTHPHVTACPVERALRIARDLEPKTMITFGDVKVPKGLQTDAFVTAWNKWGRYRSERKLPKYKPIGLHAQLMRLDAMGEARAISAINYSITQNYQGIYEERQGFTQSNPRVTQTLNAPGRYAGAADILARKRAEISQGVQPGIARTSGDA